MTDIGRAGIVMKGDYNSASTYESLDAVSYANGLYVAKQNVPAGIVPTNTTYWQVALTNPTKVVSDHNYYDDYTYNTWVNHTITFSSLTTIDNAVIGRISGWTADSPHEAVIIGISGNTITYAVKNKWSGGTAGISVYITAFGR